MLRPGPLGPHGHEDARGGCGVVPQRKAGPVYGEDYARIVETVRAESERSLPNLPPVGRNRIDEHNDRDRAMRTARRCVKNILAGRPL
jgi:hypothetical protein